VFIVGDCFDVCHDGVWEVAFVENISDFGTEIEINIAEKGIVKWLGIGEGSADSGPSFMAPYGTRVGALIEPAVSIDGILDLTGDNDIEDQGVSGNTVDDVSWRFDISVGTLTDGKDRQNSWYQACVMEIKHEEVQPAPMPPPPTLDSKQKELKSIVKTTPLKHAKNVQINEGAVEVKYFSDDKDESQLLSANQSDLEIEGSRSPTDEVRLRFEGVTTKGSSDNTVDNHSNGEASNKIGEKSSLCCADIETEVLVDVDMPSNGHIDKTPIVIEEDIINVDSNESDIVKVKTVARVSFLGCAEFNDVWVDVDSDRIAQFNTQSEGRRGDAPIRESVIFVVSKKAKDLKLGNDDVDIDSGADVFAAFKSEQDGFFHSPYYVDIINTFGEHKGFESVFQFLAMQSQSYEDTMKSNVTGSVSTTLSLSIITAVGSTCSVLTEKFLGYIENRAVINSMVHSVRQVSKWSKWSHIYMYINIYIYMYAYICICVCIYIVICVLRFIEGGQGIYQMSCAFCLSVIYGGDILINFFCILLTKIISYILRYS
jgi:hypothetical protein